MADRLRDLPKLDREGRNLQAFAEAVREMLQTFRGYRGDPLDRALTLRDAQAGGVIEGVVGTGGGSSTPGPAGPPGPPGVGLPTPDLTPPPTPTGLAVTAGFGHLFIEWDAPTYTVGHGHGKTNIYGAQWADPGDPEPTFSDAVRIGEAWDARTIYAHPASIGETWCIWLKFQSVDEVESTSPAGGANGEQATLGKIGNADLGDLIIEAANLADGAIDLESDKVKADASFGALAVGYTVTQYLVATSGIMANLLVDDAQIANLSAAKLTAGDGTIGGLLKSSGYASGTSGWIVNPDGTAEFNDVIVRGTVFSTNGVFDGEVTIRDTGGSIVFSSDGDLDYSRVSGAEKPRTYTLSAAGYLGSPRLAVGLWEGGSVVYAAAAWWNFVVMNRATGQVIAYRNYGIGVDPDGIGTFFDTFDKGYILCAWTYDDPAGISLGTTLTNALYRCGASQAKLGSAAFLGSSRGSYALVGTCGGGPDTGYEVMSAVASDSIELSFTLQDGQLSAGSGGRFQIDASNATTYIADGWLGNAIVDRAIKSSNFDGSFDASGNVTGYGTAGWGAGRGGTLVAQDAYIRGNVQATSLNAATGTFTGSLSAAGGTFAGTLTAAAVNAVNSINVAGNAITVMKGKVAATFNTLLLDFITITASDIPSGYSTVPVIVTGSWHVSAAYGIGIAYRTGSSSFAGLTANLFSGVPPLGVHAATKVVNLGVGTHWFRVGYTDGAGVWVSDSNTVDGNVHDTSMTLILGKR